MGSYFPGDAAKLAENVIARGNFVRPKLGQTLPSCQRQ